MNAPKDKVKTLISEGKFEEACKFGMITSNEMGLSDLENEFALTRGKIKKHKENWGKGLISYAEYSLKHTKIIYSLTTLVERLPDSSGNVSSIKKPITLHSYKKKVFFSSCVLKLLILLRLSYHWSTGGFNTEQFIFISVLLLPNLIAYIYVMANDFLKDNHNDLKTYLPGNVEHASIWIFIVYLFLIILFFELKVMTSITFVSMFILLGVIEGLLSGYIGKIVNKYF